MNHREYSRILKYYKFSSFVLDGIYAKRNIQLGLFKSRNSNRMLQREYPRDSQKACRQFSAAVPSLIARCLCRNRIVPLFFGENEKFECHTSFKDLLDFSKRTNVAITTEYILYKPKSFVVCFLVWDTSS